MERPALPVIMLVLAMSFLPLLSGGNDGAPASGAECPAGGRAEPDIVNGTGNHSRLAVYDFSNTFMFARWSIVMETHKAVLMKKITFTNDTWDRMAPMPAGLGRAWHVAVYDDADRLVIVEGGYCWTAGSGEPVYSQPLLTYDPAKDKWTEKGPSMLPDSSSGVWDPADRCLIVCGGKEGPGTAPAVHNETWAWFPGNSSWLRLADMPEARFGQCAAWDPDDGLMLVFGGTDGTEYHNDVWAFSYAGNNWTRLGPVSDETPLERAYSSAVWDPVRRQMLVHGGESPSVGAFMSTFAFSYACNTWVHLTSAPWIRSMHSACWNSDRGQMTVFGAGGSGNNDTYTFDVEANSFGQNARMPAEYRSGSAAVYDPVRKRMLVFGGANPVGTALEESWAFGLGDMEWEYYDTGYMQPAVLDLGEAFHSLDRVSWDARLPSGTSINLRSRSSSDNSSFGPFLRTENGSRPVNQGRYLIWNMTFTAPADRLSTPLLTEVRFEYTVNHPPACSAGQNRTAAKRQPAALSGSGSDPDGDALTYCWTRLSPQPGVLADPSSRDTTYTPLASGLHLLQLSVNDSVETSTSVVRLEVTNSQPAAFAGPDLFGFKGQNITLEGSASDPDGDPLFYNWTQLSGPAAAIYSFTTLHPVVVPTRTGSYMFQLKADDGENACYSIMNLTVVGRPPGAVLDADPREVNLQCRVNFSAANSTDPDGNVSRYWFDFGDGNSTGWTNRSATGYVYLSAGVFNATVRVMDDDGNTSEPSAPVAVAVTNALPVIGADVTPQWGNASTSFRFRVSPSSHDPDGKITSYEWSFGDGEGGSGAAVAHTYARFGTYSARLRATDDYGGIADFGLVVVVNNSPPAILSASPAGPVNITAGKKVVFSVQARDADGDRLTYIWRMDGDAVGANLSSLGIAPGAGRHVIRVSVSDGTDGFSHEWAVNAAEAPRPGPDWGPVLLGAAAAAALLMGVLALWSRRGKRK